MCDENNSTTDLTKCRACSGSFNKYGVSVIKLIHNTSTFTHMNIKVSIFKSSKRQKRGWAKPNCIVSNNKFSSVTLNELAMKAREYYKFEFQQGRLKTEMNPNGVRIA